LTYTVGNGWSNGIDKPADFLLGRIADPSSDFWGANFVGVYRDLVASTPTCDKSVATDVGHSADDLAAWIASLPGLVATAPKPASVGGLNGLVLDVHVKPGWKQKCDWAEAPAVPFALGGDPSQFRHPTHFLALGMTARLYFLRAPSGSNIVVQILDVPGGAKFQEYVSAATPVVESLHFATS